MFRTIALTLLLVGALCGLDSVFVISHRKPSLIKSPSLSTLEAVLQETLFWICLELLCLELSITLSNFVKVKEILATLAAASTESFRVS